MDTRRSQIIDIVKREFIGPDPINMPGLIQENGEEILTSDPPHIRYIAGILFPQKTTDAESDNLDSVEAVELDNDDSIEVDKDNIGGKYEYLEDAEELMNLSNSYQQSAISLTVAIEKGDSIAAAISAGIYETIREKDAETGVEHTRYYRKPLYWNNDSQSVNLPDKQTGMERIILTVDSQEIPLRLSITFRYSINNVSIYTFTLENLHFNDGHLHDDDCYFQVELRLLSAQGFAPLPDNEKLNIDDEDYLSNQMLYRNVKSYAIGHGCAAEWEEVNNKVGIIKSAVFPSYEIKPIVPSRIEGVSLEMLKLSDLGSDGEIIEELNKLCESYTQWIQKQKEKIKDITDTGTATRHINNCEECLKRMRSGVSLLETDKKVMLAFKLMNRAMLLQQLHYNLPLQNWSFNDSGILEFEKGPNIMPDINNKDTWFGDDKSRYGHWRPFQLAFVLINLKSMSQRNCDERKIVDLIWFPTGGGKTEAYLGLSAFTIFIRRLLDKNDAGTTILMRYTLRLLTSQQYERASAMICACEYIRAEMPNLLGSERISIGLWVGEGTSPNKMQDAVTKYDKLYNGTSDENPFIMLKCPWCGSQMGVVNGKGKLRATPGYKKEKIGAKKRITFQCNNEKCDFSKKDFALPLYVVDEDIYEKTPTLLLGTVDKFAMLPYRAEAQSIFGIKNGHRVSVPDLIIQDELHLISGPLGSMVGHYETMIDELCTREEGLSIYKPKIIASTATISKANEQCHALYGCGKDNVKQFPPSGLDAGDSFFAIEDKTLNGREYVGILANGSSSVATTTIRLYAALLYAAKAIKVNSESERDGYWTNIGYFNSIRELGQTETWIRADIEEYLHVIYKRRYEDKVEGYNENRRYIYEDEELTSRVRGDKIPFALQKLGIRYPSSDGSRRPVDICLATNMISVGVDVPRLGLMTVSGQPKTTSEYIQSTSRVGRDKDTPGLVFTIYNPGKPRDKSHYEHFVPYHSRIYCNVEPTSVTPFSGPLRERALHALIIGILRLEGDSLFNSNPPTYPTEEQICKIKDILSNRICLIDPDELKQTLLHIDDILEKWKREEPKKYYDFSSNDELPLMFPAGSRRNEAWGSDRGFPTPTSMRNVDASCEAYVLEDGYYSEDE